MCMCNTMLSLSQKPSHIDSFDRQKGRIWKRNLWRISISSYSNWKMREKPYYEGWQLHVSNSSEEPNDASEYSLNVQQASITQPSLADPPPWQDRNSNSTSPAIRKFLRSHEVYPKLLHARTWIWSRYYYHECVHCVFYQVSCLLFLLFKEQVSEEIILSSDFFGSWV